jgi:hypothetical protein
MMVVLPEDCIGYIIQHLPLRIQLRCVSKHEQSLIEHEQSMDANFSCHFGMVGGLMCVCGAV